jgi:Holliday junction DNA helicase RuvA
MIARLTGKVLEANFTELILDVHGVGYRLFIPISTYDALPRVGEEATLRCIMQVREDDISLYGFATAQEQGIFELLITVNGIGAKTALNILSSMNIPGFCAAVAQGDVKSLKKINGVGPKSAERIIIELRDKIDKIVPESTFIKTQADDSFKELEDALIALEKLGFPRAKIQKTVTDVALAIPENQRSCENIIRKSLAALNR